MNWESIAKSAIGVASGVINSFSPLGGKVLGWAGAVAFEVYDMEKASASNVAVAQHVADRAVDLISDIKFGK